jgi:hypothetical protein
MGDCRFAGFGGTVAAVVALSILPPQAGTATATSGIANALVRRVMTLHRVMVTPLS